MPKSPPIGAEFFRSVGLGPDIVRIQVNNRRLMDAQLRAMGIAGDLVPAVFKVIDKREKMDDQTWSEYAASVGLSAAADRRAARDAEQPRIVEAVG